MKYRVVGFLPLNLLAFLALLSSLGCGGPEGPKLVEVQGKVTYQDKALEKARVTYLPVPGTEGVGGTGITDAEGNYTITYRRGGTGLPVGKYKVTVSKRLMPDGSIPPEDVEPMDSPARETLPGTYSQEEQTTLTKTVSETGGDYNFDLK